MLKKPEHKPKIRFGYKTGVKGLHAPIVHVRALKPNIMRLIMLEKLFISRKQILPAKFLGA